MRLLSSRRTRNRVAAWASALVLLPLLGVLRSAAPAAAETLPTGFRDSVVLSGLTYPKNAAFAADGRVFVAEKSGIVKVFDSLTDTTPTVFADLRPEVHDYWDRGLLGMALAPNFPTD